MLLKFTLGSFFVLSLTAPIVFAQSEDDDAPDCSGIEDSIERTEIRKEAYSIQIEARQAVLDEIKVQCDIIKTQGLAGVLGGTGTGGAGGSFEGPSFEEFAKNFPILQKFAGGTGDITKRIEDRVKKMADSKCAKTTSSQEKKITRLNKRIADIDKTLAELQGDLAKCNGGEDDSPIKIPPIVIPTIVIPTISIPKL